MVFVYFVYGLSFFTLGLAVLVYPKRDSIYPLASDMWPIGAFGVTHGISEWLAMFRAFGPVEESAAVDSLTLGIVSLSFAFLLVFAAKAAHREGLSRVFLVAPLSLPVLWLLVVGWSPDRTRCCWRSGSRKIIASSCRSWCRWRRSSCLTR